MFNEMKGGEIFVPKIPSVEITELANAIAPYNNQKITGIRPGEKISEVLISEEESMYTYETHDHYVILPIILDSTPLILATFNSKLVFGIIAPGGA